MSGELAALDATAQAALVTCRELTARELVDAAIERLERRNPELNAVTHSDLDLARERADAVEQLEQARPWAAMRPACFG